MVWDETGVMVEQVYSSMEPSKACAEAEPGPAEVRHSDGRWLIEHWQACRSGNCAPPRSAIDARPFFGLLPWTGLLAVDTQRGYHWRAAGSGIVKLWGHDPNGKAFARGWPQFDQSIMERALGGVTERMQPFVALLDLASKQRKSLQIEFIGLPIEAKPGGQRQVLCGVFPFEEPDGLGRASPSAFELISLRPIRIEPCLQVESSLAPPRKRRVALRVIEGGA